MPRIPIHREGYKFIFYSLLLTTIIQILLLFTSVNAYVSCLVFLINISISLWIIYFFRDPVVANLNYPQGILSPATGTILAIEETFESEFFKDKRLKISVFMSPFDVHVNRNPISGVVSFFKHHHGDYLIAFHPKSSEKNERTTIVIETEQGVKILFRQIAGFIARRICYYDEISKKVTQGAECGFIKFGSRADVFIPLNSEIKLKIGDKVQAGLSIIADLAK